MGRPELLEALQREGRETMAAIIAREAVDTERLRRDAEDRRTALRSDHDRQCTQLCSSQQRAIMSKAAAEAALLRLRSEYLLALRLREIAGTCLPQLRAADASPLFRRLLAELPPEEWGQVRVNPADTALAAKLLPQAEIVAVAELSGGLLVTSSDNSLTVDNTLEKRLERLWPELLPELTAAVKALVTNGTQTGGGLT